MLVCCKKPLLPTAGNCRCDHRHHRVERQDHDQGYGSCCLMTTYKVTVRKATSNNHIGTLPLTILQMDDVYADGGTGDGDERQRRYCSALSKIALPETVIITILGKRVLQQSVDRAKRSPAKAGDHRGAQGRRPARHPQGRNRCWWSWGAGPGRAAGDAEVALGAQDVTIGWALYHHQDYISFELNVPSCR